MPFNNPLSWLLIDEGATGKTAPTPSNAPDGNLNRPLLQLLENDQFLKGFTDSHQAYFSQILVSAGMSPAPITADLVSKALAVLSRANSWCIEAIGSAANVYRIATRSPYPTVDSAYGLRDGMEFTFRTQYANTGTCTLQVDGQTARAILNQNGTPLLPGTLPANTDISVRYNIATLSFVLSANIGGGGGGGSSVLLTAGFGIANNTASAVPTKALDIAPGAITTNLGVIVQSTTTISKRIDQPWIEDGTTATPLGGLATNLTATPSTWYRVFVISKPDGTGDIGFDTSSTATNLLAANSAGALGYTSYIRIGWIYYTAASEIKEFFQVNDRFTWKVPVENVNRATSITAQLAIITTPPDVDVEAEILYATDETSGPTSSLYTLVTATRQPDTTPSSTVYNYRYIDGANFEGGQTVMRVFMDSSSQIRTRTNVANVGDKEYVSALGWVDHNLYNGSSCTVIRQDASSSSMAGFSLANNLLSATPTKALDIYPGEATTNLNIVAKISTVLSKRVDQTWALGGTANTPVGGLAASLTATPGTWYRVFIIAKTDGTTDIGFDTNSAAVNLLAGATGFISYKRIGWIYYNGSSAIRKFWQTANKFVWDEPAFDVNLSTLPVGASQLLTLTAPPDVNCFANINAYLQINNASPVFATAGYFISLTSTKQTDPYPLSNYNPVSSITSGWTLFCDELYAAPDQTSGYTEIGMGSSSQIRLTPSSNIGYAANTNALRMATNGWVDYELFSNNVLSVSSSASQRILHIRDEKPSGTEGGSFSNGSFVTRAINTVLTNTIQGASQGALNTIVLPPGTYQIFATVPAFDVGRHKAQLYNVTTASAALQGTTENTTTGTDSVQTRSNITGQVVVPNTGNHTFDIRHRCANTKATNGWGRACGFGIPEVYTEILITKVD